MTTFKMKTPLRYPGGKSRAMKFLSEHFPQDIQSYVEPFLGGGSVALWVTQQYPHATIHVNDAYHPLYCFWQQLQHQGKEMADRLEDLKRSTEHSQDDQKELYYNAQKIMHDDLQDPFAIACLSHWMYLYVVLIMNDYAILLLLFERHVFVVSWIVLVDGCICYLVVVV